VSLTLPNGFYGRKRGSGALGFWLAFGAGSRYLTAMAIREPDREDAGGGRRWARRERSRSPRRTKPRRFGDLPDGAWGRIARRSFDQFGAKGLTNLAAALTYRSVLSLFPGLLALVALLGVLGQYPRTYDAVLAVARRVVPASVVQSISGPLQGVITNKGGAAALLGVGLAVTIWAASGYIGAFSWAMNIVWEAERDRSWYRQWPFNVAVALLLLVFAGAVQIVLVLTGELASSVGKQLGVGANAISAWQVVRWPVMAGIVINLVAALYYVTPNVRPPSLRWITPGAIISLAAWLVFSAAFAAYLAHFGSYNKTYGTLGAVITFLVWLWFTNIAILVGAQIDAEIERERELAAGIDARQRIQLPLRESG
jgi:membrane protein